MRKILLTVLCLLLCGSAQASITVTAGNNYDLLTASAITTTTTSSVTSTFSLGNYDAASFQCAWAAVTGTQPQYKLQVSNDATNWDDVSGVTTITTSTSGSDTWVVDPIPVRKARIAVTTASTTGTLTCTAVGQGGKK
jgi:hypothetical protein